jgi:hypothetical protein
MNFYYSFVVSLETDYIKNFATLGGSGVKPVIRERIMEKWIQLGTEEFEPT